jgi:hypothetical protein
MAKQDWFQPRGRFVLSLLVLVANVVAPFRTSAGRALVDLYGRPLVSHAALRVRPHFQTVPSHCFRAVVGIARGQSVDALAAPIPASRTVLPSSSTTFSEPRETDLVSSLLRPPLRC